MQIVVSQEVNKQIIMLADSIQTMYSPAIVSLHVCLLARVTSDHFQLSTACNAKVLSLTHV